MRLLRVVNTRTGQELGNRIQMADRWLARLRGMVARPAPQRGEGLLLTPCSSVHMYGMRFALDVAFLDDGGTVIAMYPRLPPRARTRWHRNAAHALELPPGFLEDSGTSLGDVLIWSTSVASTEQYSRMEAVS